MKNFFWMFHIALVCQKRFRTKIKKFKLFAQYFEFFFFNFLFFIHFMARNIVAHA